jgi:hypothetical protein
VKDVGEPCAGEPHARFDGRGLETERDRVTAPVLDPTNLHVDPGLDSSERTLRWTALRQSHPCRYRHPQHQRRARLRTGPRPGRRTPTQAHPRTGRARPTALQRPRQDRPADRRPLRCRSRSCLCHGWAGVNGRLRAR